MYTGRIKKHRWFIKTNLTNDLIWGCFHFNYNVVYIHESMVNYTKIFNYVIYEFIIAICFLNKFVASFLKSYRLNLLNYFVNHTNLKWKLVKLFFKLSFSLYMRNYLLTLHNMSRKQWSNFLFQLLQLLLIQ